MLPALLAAFAFTLGPELPSSTPITEPARTASDPMVASDGRDFLLEWNDARGGPRIAKVASDGTITPPYGKPIGTYGPLAWNGSNYANVGLGARRDVEVTRIDREGNVLDVVPRIGATLPDYAFLSLVSGPRILMISADSATGKQQAHVLDAEGQLIRSASLPQYFHTLALGSNGKEFLVLYSDGIGGAPFVVRLSLDGMLLGAPIAIGQSGSDGFLIASDGDGYLIVRVSRSVGGPSAAQMMALSAGGVPRGAATTLALPYGLSVGGSVAWSGSAYVFAILG